MMFMQRSTTVSTTWTIHDLATRQDEDEIFLDLAFQSTERWSKVSQLAYLNSVFSGFTPNPIILADVTSCMNYCEELLGKDSEDYKYYAKLHSEGVKYISVDGNNRTRTLMRFFNNTLQLKENNEYRMSGMTIPEYMNFKPTNSVGYKGLPDKLKEHIRNIEIPVFVVNSATRQELHNMFIAVNNGVSLNPQEKRNAIVCKVADAIRLLGDKYKKMLRLYFKDSNCQRRIHEEFLVASLVHITYGFETNIMREDKDAAYNDASAETKKIGKLKEVLKDLDSIIQYENKTGKTRGIPSKASLFDLVMLLDYLQNQNISVMDDSTFFDWFVENINKLREDTKTFITFGKDGRTYYGAQRNTTAEVREARLSQLIARLDTLPEGTLSVQKDKKRFGDWTDRISCWTTQEHTCPLTGKNIPWSDVLDGNKTHLDHIIAHSKGGKTTRENLQLVYKNANLRKSDD
jgi:hypothetical protein